ncbi:MAG: HupE/UreJ family protein, partial [Gammaproteobacteria bacterium]|nr:HupE/UreJ family protein [Gammaproteobacteria bacterium]
FGFAGALAEIGLPQQSIPLALLFFNVGVELGQLVFVGAVIGAGWMLRKLIKERILQGSEVAASYLIGSLSAFWLIERSYSFWS